MQSNFTEIYETYSPRILIYLSRLVGRDNSEDLMQEVFIKVFNSINTFSGNSKISTWIYKIATNTAYDKLKSFSYRKEKTLLTSLNYIEPLKVNVKPNNLEELDIEYRFIHDEMNQCIADYINRLPDNYRTIFLLSEYESYPVDEIAEIMDISVDNVKIRLHRARKKLHKMFMAGCNFYYDEYSKLRCDKK